VWVDPNVGRPTPGRPSFRGRPKAGQIWGDPDPRGSTLMGRPKGDPWADPPSTPGGSAHGVDPPGSTRAGSTRALEPFYQLLPGGGVQFSLGHPTWVSPPGSNTLGQPTGSNPGSTALGRPSGSTLGHWVDPRAAGKQVTQTQGDPARVGDLGRFWVSPSGSVGRPRFGSAPLCNFPMLPLTLISLISRLHPSMKQDMLKHILRLRLHPSISCG
jgi:hypothetical protein